MTSIAPIEIDSRARAMRNVWKCHQQHGRPWTSPLKNFDHYGRFRSTEACSISRPTEKQRDQKGENIGPATREVALDTSGTIANSGDVRLDGTVRDPRELVLRLADSDRVRQVFNRHAFRY